MWKHLKLALQLSHSVSHSSRLSHRALAKPLGVHPPYWGHTFLSLFSFTNSPLLRASRFSKICIIDYDSSQSEKGLFLTTFLSLRDHWSSPMTTPNSSWTWPLLPIPLQPHELSATNQATSQSSTHVRTSPTLGLWQFPISATPHISLLKASATGSGLTNQTPGCSISQSQFLDYAYLQFQSQLQMMFAWLHSASRPYPTLYGQHGHQLHSWQHDRWLP